MQPLNCHITLNTPDLLLSLVVRPIRVVKYCDEYVCLSVCLSARMTPKPAVELHQIFVHVDCPRCRGSVLLWRRCDTLCTSGFTDDVMLSYNGTNGRTGTALCSSPAPVDMAAARARAAAAHWLAGSAGRLAGPGGWTRLLPGTVMHVSPCASL